MAPQKMKCPKDQSILKPQTYESDIDTNTCPQCGGMWLDKGKLEAIQETLEHDYTTELARFPDLVDQAYEKARQLKLPQIYCPCCHLALERKEYGYCSQIEIDYCPQCSGIWLDRGEIEALELFFERSRFESRDIRRAFWASLRAMLS